MLSLPQELSSRVPSVDTAIDAAPPLIGGPQRDLLCTLAYVYLASGQPARALPLLRLVQREADDDVGFLRVLAYALIADANGAEAIRIIERLEQIDRGANARAPLLLMRSHALRLVGRLDEARECFRTFRLARLLREGDVS